MPFSLHKAKRVATNAYIAPFLDPARAKVMLIGFLANFGYGCLSFTLNYDMAGHGLAASMTYQCLRMLMMGYLAVPLTFWFLSRFKSRYILPLIQIPCLGLYFVDRSSGLLNAIAITIAFSPFLAMHSYRFGKNISSDNRGNETALNSYLIIFGYSVGLFLGGLALQHDLYYTAVIISSLCTIVGAMALYRPVGGSHNIEKMRSLISLNKPSSRITFFLGLMNPMIDGCMPIWMRVIGISPLGAGVNMSLRPMIGLLLTPFVGWLIQKKGFRAGQIGGVAMIFGWILVASAKLFPWIFSFSLALLTTGINLLSPMEVGRWQRRRSSAAVMCREILVASGRAPSYVIGTTTCFLLPAAYPLVGLALSGLFIFGSVPRRGGMAKYARKKKRSSG